MNDRAGERQVFEVGTTEPVLPTREVKAGPISAIIESGALRTISFGDLELIRQIDFPVRDQNWASLQPHVVSEKLDETATGFRYEYHFEVDGGALICRVVYTATSDGLITAEGEAEARRDFITNRTGFTVLHPIDGFSGQPVQVRNVSGGVETAVMPELISPDQPMKDIAGLTFDLGGTKLDIAFEGETFEMEDQRNWSDASYKTYCRPLVEPFAYDIKAGSALRQVIKVSMSGKPDVATTGASAEVTIGPALDESLPELLLAGDDGWLADAEGITHLAASGLKALLLRVTPANAVKLLPEAKLFVESLSGALDLEVVLDDDPPAEPQLQSIASICTELELSPRHVMALPSAYLKSYQPSSVWPKGLSPDDAFTAAEVAFPKARVGAGMLTNFTEFNRCRPDKVSSDYITHGNTATVHAADDASVMQTLETLPHVFKSARAIGGDRACRLGLTAIGMRSNPYGAAISENPDQLRLTMATWDPRARALFGAAFAIGALAVTEGQGIEAITLASPAGPFGVLSSGARVKRPWYDEYPEAMLHPIFHVLKALSNATKRHALQNLPRSFAGVAASDGDETTMVIANLTGDTQRLPVAADGETAILDRESFTDAVKDTHWLEHAMKRGDGQSVDLTAYACLFMKGKLKI